MSGLGLIPWTRRQSWVTVGARVVDVLNDFLKLFQEIVSHRLQTRKLGLEVGELCAKSRRESLDPV